MATTARSAPKPLTPAQAYFKQQRQAHLIRLGVLLLILLFFVQPLIPSPIAGYDWRAKVWAQIEKPLMQPFPSAEVAADLPVGITPSPMLNWIYRVMALGGIWLILGMLMHVVSIYQQRTRPLTQERSYLLVRTPLTLNIKPQQGVGLLRTLHGALPVAPLGSGVPLVFRWSSRPQEEYALGVSLLGSETFVKSMQKLLQGVGRGTEVEVIDDPLISACEQGRILCWCEASLAAGNGLPILPVTNAESPLIDSLLSALAPQGGIFANDVQLIVRPVCDQSWRMPVLARIEASKDDSNSSERKALEQRAAGPAYDISMRLLVIAENAESGSAQLQTLASALAASMQSVGSIQQRLVAGPIHTLPAVLEPPAPLPRHLIIGLPICALLGGAGGSLLLWQWGIGSVASQLLALPFLLAFVPLFAYQTWRFRRQRGQQWQQLQTVLKSVPAPRNPNTIPLWSDWFGYRSR
jgi:hypothetical protein